MALFSCRGGRDYTFGAPVVIGRGRGGHRPFFGFAKHRRRKIGLSYCEVAYRELDDTRGLTNTGADTLADARTAKNARHLLVGLLHQSVFGRLAGY
jgi:hypothetical protein